MIKRYTRSELCTVTDRLSHTEIHFLMGIEFPSKGELSEPVLQINKIGIHCM